MLVTELLVDGGEEIWHFWFWGEGHSQERKDESKGSLLVLTAFNQRGFLQYWLITSVRDDQFLLSLVFYVIAGGGSVEF